MGVKATGEGLRAYYKGKIEELEMQMREKQHNLRRMEAQRNELNTKGELHGATLHQSKESVTNIDASDVI